jgi:hypothetical protein
VAVGRDARVSVIVAVTVMSRRRDLTTTTIWAILCMMLRLKLWLHA